MGFGLRFPIQKTDDSTVLAAITSEGRVEAENYASGGPQFDVLATLNEKSPLTVSAICRETGLSMGKVKGALKALAHDGYVRKVQSSNEIMGQS